MDVSEMITMAGAAIAAVSSSVGLWWQWKDREARLILKFGELHPTVFPGHFLYVVNRSKHNITIRDYGFIGNDGRVHSLPFLASSAEPGDDVHLKLLNTMAPDSPQEAWIEGFDWDVVAVYAVSSTADRPLLAFRPNSMWSTKVPRSIRLSLRWHAYVGGMNGLYARRDKIAMKAGPVPSPIPFPASDEYQGL